MTDLVKRLRQTTAKMASACSAPMGLWQDHATAALKAANRIEELERQNAALRASLREMFCPRPCNHRPSEFDVGDCVAAGECGCGANHALSDSTPTPLQEQKANGEKEEG